MTDRRKSPPISRILVAAMTTMLCAPMAAAPSTDSWAGLRISRSSWEPAVINETDKLRAVSQVDSVLFAGTLLSLPGVYYSYGNTRQALTSADLVFSFGGTQNRGNLELGYGTSSPTDIMPAGYTYSNSNFLGLQLLQESRQVDILQSADLKRFRLGYDHEIYPFASDESFLSDFGLIIGLQAVRDEFVGDFVNTGQTISNTGSGPNTNNYTAFNSLDHKITTGDLQLGIIYRKAISEVLDLEAAVSFGMGVYGTNEATLTSLTTFTFGTTTIPLQSESEISSEGDVRTSRFRLGLTYKVSPEFAISGRYSVENRFFTPTAATMNTGGIFAFEVTPMGPYYTQKDKLSGISVEFQYRY